jgi:hypothetical protein
MIICNPHRKLDTHATYAHYIINDRYIHAQRIVNETYIGKRYKGKAVPLLARSGPEGPRRLKFLDFMTTAQDGGRVVSLTHRPPLPPGNTPGGHFCQRLSRSKGHSATGSVMSPKNSNDTIGNRTRDLPVCSIVP